jgi:hypothetical protein
MNSGDTKALTDMVVSAGATSFLADGWRKLTADLEHNLSEGLSRHPIVGKSYIHDSRNASQNTNRRILLNVFKPARFLHISWLLALFAAQVRIEP